MYLTTAGGTGDGTRTTEHGTRTTEHGIERSRRTNEHDTVQKDDKTA